MDGFSNTVPAGATVSVAGSVGMRMNYCARHCTLRSVSIGPEGRRWQRDRETMIATVLARAGDRFVGLTSWMAMRARPRIGCSCLSFCSAPHRKRGAPGQGAGAPPGGKGRGEW